MTAFEDRSAGRGQQRTIDQGLLNVRYGLVAIKIRTATN
jgi:hypothetical protein